MSEPSSFDPEVVALLQEVARDSGSTLLRLPKHPLSRWVARPEEVLSPRGSNLTKLERHLVEAYREEAAWVLEQACILQLKRLPLVFSESASSPDGVRKRATALAGSGTLGSVAPELGLVVVGEEVTPVQLGSASLRLAPRDSTRNTLAVALERANQRSSAKHLLERLLEGRPCALQQSKALENISQYWFWRRDFQKAGEASLAAARADSSQIRPLVWCLTAAVQEGDERKVRDSARRLAMHPRSGEASFLARALLDGRSRAFWEPTVSGRALAARIRMDVDQQAWEVLDVFA